MKNKYESIHIYKVRHSHGVKYNGSYFKYVGESRIDKLPVYSCKLKKGESIDWNRHLRDFVFNTLPGYTPIVNDFEIIEISPIFSSHYLESLHPDMEQSSELYEIY